jgi:epoxyqueuosine reductase
MLVTLRNTQRIKDEAKRLGFDDCGVAKAEELPDEAVRFRSWLDKGYHGEMGYMENYFDKRVDPSKLVEGTKSVISVILNYYPEQHQQDPEAPVLSKYAYGEDYHFVVKRKLKELKKFIDNEIQVTSGRAFVDSAPVLDRAWAARSGLGWIGKNTNLISPKHGSFVFIGSLFVDLDLEYDHPINDYCGDCNKCIQACPTNALVGPRQLDGSKCISYFTIEFKHDELPYAYKEKFKNRVFGCDICQDVCPWNKKVKPNHVPEFKPSSELMNLSGSDWHKLNVEKYKLLFKKSPVKRAKLSGLKRNLAFLSNQ